MELVGAALRPLSTLPETRLSQFDGARPLYGLILLLHVLGTII